MPYVKIEVTREGVTREQKQTLIKGVTDLISDVLNKDPQLTHVVIQEIDLDDWGLCRRTGISAERKRYNCRKKEIK
jgi:4-oxalocrotonate tautomerase